MFEQSDQGKINIAKRLTQTLNSINKWLSICRNVHTQYKFEDNRAVIFFRLFVTEKTIDQFMPLRRLTEDIIVLIFKKACEKQTSHVFLQKSIGFLLNHSISQKRQEKKTAVIFLAYSVMCDIIIARRFCIHRKEKGQKLRINIQQRKYRNVKFVLIVDNHYLIEHSPCNLYPSVDVLSTTST